MPFTPYHFGPSGFVGLLFRRWIDLPIFLLANVLVDIEVLVDGMLEPGWPVHQIWHGHTFLIGGIVGILFGAGVYLIKPLRRLLDLVMKVFYLPQKSSLVKMSVSGMLGVWMHVLIDGIYHYDVQPFWPQTKNFLYNSISRGHPGYQDKVKIFCVIFWAAAIILYAGIVWLYLKKRKCDGTDGTRASHIEGM